MSPGRGADIPVCRRPKADRNVRPTKLPRDSTETMSPGRGADIPVCRRPKADRNVRPTKQPVSSDLMVCGFAVQSADWQPEPFGSLKRIPQLLASEALPDQVATQVAKSARILGRYTS